MVSLGHFSAGTGGTWRPKSAGLTRKDKLIESVWLYIRFTLNKNKHTVHFILEIGLN